MNAPRHALTRRIPTTFADATVMTPHAGAPIDVALAREQHATYVEALRGLGLAVTVLDADDAHPDCCFVEDTCVLAGDVALVTTPGAPSRRGEVPAIRAALPAGHRVEAMALPATLDGGDCLRTARRIYVGRTARTNAAGVTILREAFAPLGLTVVEVPVADALHLKCFATPLGNETLLLAEGWLAPATFDDQRVITIPAEEAYAANVLAVGDTVLMAAGFPRTRRILQANGFKVIALDTTEFRKADGSLTCLSLLY